MGLSGGLDYYHPIDGWVRGSTAIVALYSAGLLLKIGTAFAPETVFEQLGAAVAVMVAVESDRKDSGKSIVVYVVGGGRIGAG